MLIALYSLLLTIGLVVSAPWWLFQMATTERYREGLRHRLGAVQLELGETVQGKRVVWVHAVSVGEVLAATRLVAELGAALGDGWVVVVSTTTRTGQALARERFGMERVFYMPLDFAFAVRKYMRVLRPAALVLMESELWPRLLHECKSAEIPVVVVNARVSDRSFARAVRVKSIWARVLRKVSLWLAQSEEDARRLVVMGALADAVKVGGNLKYDVRAPKESHVAELIKAAAAGRPIVVAGSTVGGTNDREPDEEGWLITAWGGRVKNQTSAVLVLAPRHPERFDQVWSDARSEFATVKTTELLAGISCTQFSLRGNGETCRPDIIILDTIGDLAAVYRVADIAFLGGSLIKRGGHNPLEPAQFGVPVVMGPSYENFRDIVTKMISANGISVTSGEARLASDLSERDKPLHAKNYVMRNSLESQLMQLLINREAAKAMGERGRRVFEEQQGATKYAVDAIVALVNA